MLLVQDICLSWDKKERGAVYAKMRANFPIAYPFHKLPNTFPGDVVVHRLNFWQKETIFQPSSMNDKGCFQFYSSVQDLNLTNLSIQSDDAEIYEITFFYDERRSGLPVRQGHNKDYHNTASLLYRHDILNETAFSLGKGQYGRIIWNERKRYYQWHIVNLLHLLDNIPKRDLFLTCQLDFEYKQMATLY